MKIKLTAKQLVTIENFCHRVSEARESRNRYNNDSGKHRIEREITGKVGEYAAWAVSGIGEVDFSIHETGSVKFDGDLTPTTHVKTCHSKYRGSNYDGWLIDKGDPVRKNPGDSDFIILVYADNNGNADVIGCVWAYDLLKHWRRPMNSKLRHKDAIYMSEIKHLIEPVEVLQ